MNNNPMGYSQPPMQQQPMQPGMPQGMQPQKKSKVPIIIAIVVIVIALLVVAYFLVMKKDDEKDTKSNSNSNTSENTNSKEETASPQFTMNYPEWVGFYEGGDYKLVMYYENHEDLRFSLVSGKVTVNDDGSFSTSSSSWDLNIKADSPTEIHYEEDGEEITVTKTTTGVHVVIKEEDPTKNVDVELTKNNFTSNGFTGIYTNKQNILIINEIDSEECTIMYGSTDQPYLLDSYSATNGVTDLQVKEDSQTIATITKSASGVTVTSTEWESGEYIKQ